jgi:hypothetical protein
MNSSLADLDELILKCRDDKAKAYIAESVASYRAGAYRSAIVGAWIAVCFDVMDKIRELALSGDQEAEKHAEELEKTRQSGDISKALKFEREFLELARDKFELISHVEFVDLERLQEDRNRCAHPSLISEEQIFLPSAELARLHIRSAVTHLLQHPPAQGKYALSRLVKEVDSDYFPDNTETARLSLSSGPLRKPRESLVRNFIIILIKKLLQENLGATHKRRVAAALNAVAILYPQYHHTTLSHKLSPTLRLLDDAELKRIIPFFQLVNDSWQHVEKDVSQRIEKFVSALPIELFERLDFLLAFDPLREQAKLRVNRATREELKTCIFFTIPDEIADRIINIYLIARSYDEANEWAKQIDVYASDLSETQIRLIVTKAASNDQVLHSFELGPLLNVLRGRRKITEEEFNRLLKANGLSKFAPATPQIA